jgi:protein-disulfide isomerase-like protein with CxxC motif
VTTITRVVYWGSAVCAWCYVISNLTLS